MRISDQERLGRIAAAFEAQLDKQGVLPITQAVESDLLREARAFLKSLKKEHKADYRIQAFIKQLNASRLGITIDALDASPGFEKFSNDTVLYRYLYIYHDNLKIDARTNEILIKQNDIYTLWRHARKIVEIPPLPKRKDYPMQWWVYGEHGIQNKDMYNWITPVPFKKEDPENWGRRTFFVFCTTRPEKLGLSGYHSWFRIIRKDGNVYSIGKYRPEKQSFKEHIKQPLRVKPGYIMCPDVNEFWPQPIEETWVEITESQADRILEAVEERKRNEEHEDFHNLLRNCTVFDNQMAELAGVRLPTRMRIWRLFAPFWFQRLIERIDRYTPAFVSDGIDRLTAFWINFVGYMFLGATKVDQTLHESISPHITHWKELFDPDKASVHHPNTLSQVITKINIWREQEKRRLNIEKSWYEQGRTAETAKEVDLAIEQIDQQLAQLDGAVPAEYRFNENDQF